MILADTAVFPSNIIEVLVPAVTALDADLAVFRRPLRSTDPNQSVGIFPSNWSADERSQEMGGNAPGEPTIQRYSMAIQGFVKDGDEIAGLAKHSKLSALIRSMLYRDRDVHIALTSLSHVSLGSTERLMRWGVGRQQFLSNEVQASWLYLSTLEIWADTTSS